ncbi:hypothetical protein HZH66_000820 [Vespula vulgaris]|uniref:Uncharacterized protein n=1 Tax=Vespula vulgaris TaxID=7454 RepID=A0A834KPV8_VESVU|nr:hypothetical protein HZH66_000820 [Vespula vulgaris]
MAIMRNAGTALSKNEIGVHDLNSILRSPNEEEEKKIRNPKHACVRKMELKTRGEHPGDSSTQAKSKYTNRVRFFFIEKRRLGQKPTPKRPLSRYFQISQNWLKECLDIKTKLHSTIHSIPDKSVGNWFLIRTSLCPYVL